MPTDEDIPRGYILVEPDLVFEVLNVNNDAAVGCLAYLISVIAEDHLAPKGLKFEIIPAQYLGPPYPAIGMYSDTFVDTNENLMRFSFKLGDELSAIIAQLGLTRIMELASHQSLTWDDVLNDRKRPPNHDSE